MSKTVPLAAVLIGGASLLAVVAVDPAWGLGGLLTAGVFGISVALGAAIFLAIQGASGARWWTPLGPVASAIAGTFVLPAGLVAVAVGAGVSVLYPWAKPGAMEASHLLHEKSAWLNRPLFLARVFLVLLVWLGVTAWLRDRLAAFQGRPSAETRRGFARASIVFLLVLAPAVSVYAWDVTMSLEPEWFSTMYSVYVFSGSFLAGLAAIAFVATTLEARGAIPPLPSGVRHDLGKLLFGFATFWAYIWFSQYLLIWYSNLPEETPYFALRHQGGWTSLFWINPVLSWLVPFIVLMPAGPKRTGAFLGQVSLVVLIGRGLDAWLTVGPSQGPVPAFPLAAAGATALVVGGMVLLGGRSPLAPGGVFAAAHGTLGPRRLEA